MSKIKVVCLVGPTGVGKTSTSIKLAKLFNGEIISADSMQIYKDMNIGTAKITKEEMNGVEHHLLDIVEPCDSFSVAEWKELAEKKIRDITSRGKTPFVVGGTCLYVDALINNFQFYNSIRNNETRKKYEDILETDGVEKLYSLLVEKDSEFAKTVDPKKARAIIRYLEILENENVDLKKKDSETGEFEFLLIGLNRERELLYKNINSRVDQMFADGLETEVDALIKKYNFNSTMQSAGAIGYREFWNMLDGLETKEKVIELIKQHSRNYAKRQLTYMRRMTGLEWMTASDFDKIEARVKKFLQG